MINWTLEQPIGRIKLTGTVAGAEAVVVEAIPVPNFELGGMTITATRLWVHPDYRADDGFALEVYLGILGQAVDLGYLTEEQLVDYEWVPNGVRVGNVMLLFSDESLGAMLRYRLVSRGKVEEVAAENGLEVRQSLLADEQEVAEYAQALRDHEASMGAEEI